MVDTARTSSDLLTNLFQDGQAAGAITPQDVRDLIKSFAAEHGGIYVSTPASTTISVAGTAVKGAGTTTVFGATAVNWDMPTDNRLRYTGTPTRTALINCSASISVDSAVLDKLLSVQLYKNGALITGAVNTGYAAQTTAKEVNIAVFATVSLATNDYVEAWITNEDSTDNITIQKMTLTGISMVA